MTEYRLSIDYGTTNTVAYLQPPKGDPFPLLFDRTPLLPSAVFAQPDGTLLTGREAVFSAGLDPGSYEPNPKRRIADGTVLLGGADYPVASLIGATLARVLAEARERSGGAPLRVVLTYPAAWSSERRDVLRTAAGSAQINQPHLVTEPEAAAAFLAGAPEGVPLIVYDLGAGTCDVSAVLNTGHGFDRLDCAGLDDVGGLDLDEVVLKRVGQSIIDTHPDEWVRLLHPEADDRRYARLFREEARLAKERLSTERITRVLVPLIDQDVPVRLSEFEHDARPLLARTVDVTARVLRKAKVGRDDPAELFLVGGATRTPLVGVLLGQSTGRTPRRVDHPEQVVAEGALRHLAISRGEPTRTRTVYDTEPAGPHDGRTLREPVPTVRERVPETVIQAIPAGAPPDYRKFVPNPQQHLGSTVRYGSLFAGGLIVLGIFDPPWLLNAILVLLTLAGLAGVAVKIFEWVRCIRDTRPMTVDPIGIRVTQDGAETLFRWSEMATVYLQSHRGTRWLVCTPASNSRLGSDGRSRKFWAQPYGLFLLTSVSGYKEPDVREALDRYSGGRHRG